MKCRRSLDLIRHVEPRASASSSSHLLSSTTIGQPDGVDALGQALVLCGHAFGGVDDEQRDVGVVDRCSARTSE